MKEFILKLRLYLDYILKCLVLTPRLRIRISRLYIHVSLDPEGTMTPHWPELVSCVRPDFSWCPNYLLGPFSHDFFTVHAMRSGSHPERWSQDDTAPNRPPFHQIGAFLISIGSGNRAALCSEQIRRSAESIGDWQPSDWRYTLE